jgi:hypothetical protein
MRRDKLEALLGARVIVTFKDGDYVSGVLTKGHGYEDKYYTCGDDGLWFRCSHVKKIFVSDTKKEPKDD